MNRMNDYRQSYDDIPIPPELDKRLRDTIAQAQREQRRYKRMKRWMFSLVALFVIWISSLNVSPQFAQAMAAVPGFQSIVSALTIHEIVVEQNTYEAHIETPTVTNITDPELEQVLNAKYIAESEALYDSFEKKLVEMEDAGGGHLAVDSKVEVITDTDILFVLSRSYSETQGSSSYEIEYDNVDKQLGVVLTLPSLFINDEYIDRINEYIVHYLEDEQAVSINPEQKPLPLIDAEQQFFISNNKTLNISFDKYEITAGAYGPITIEIPTSLINDLLVSHRYIQ